MELKMETAVKKARLLTLALNESGQNPEFLLPSEVKIFKPPQGGDVSLQLLMFGIGSILPSRSQNILHVIGFIKAME